MEVIDGQLHVSEVEHAPAGKLPSGRPWSPMVLDHTKKHGAILGYLNIDTAIAAMDAVGVDSAILIIAATYRERLANGTFMYDNSYGEEGATKYPGRLMNVTHLDHRLPDVAERVAAVRKHPGTLGIRVVIGRQPNEGVDQLRAGEYERLFTAAERNDVPIMLFVNEQIPAAGWIAEAHPNLPIIIHHIGIPLPPLMTPDPDPWQRLPQVLALAAYPNIAIKISRAPTISRTGFPFSDLWPNLHKIIEAFTPDRILWGTDITTCRGFCTYAEALHYIKYTNELSETDKAKILGGTLRTWLRWPKAPSGSVATRG